MAREPWDAVCARYDWRCYYCGIQTLDLQREHKIPRSRGGSGRAENIVPACPDCNARKGTRTAQEFLPLIDRESRANRWQSKPLTYRQLVRRNRLMELYARDDLSTPAKVLYSLIHAGVAKPPEQRFPFDEWACRLCYTADDFWRALCELRDIGLVEQDENGTRIRRPDNPLPIEAQP